MAAAIATCCKWVFARPQYRVRRRPKARTVQFDSGFGPVTFAPALLHLALRSGAIVAFCEAHLEGGRIRGAIALASAASGAGVEREYVDFMVSFMRRRAASTAVGRLEQAVR